MLGIFGAIGGLLSTVSGISGQVFGYLTKKADVSLEKYKVDGKVDEALVQADVTLIQAQRDLLLAQNPYRGYRYLHYLFGYPLGIYWTLYLFDKVTEKAPGFEKILWDVEPITGDYLVWASVIMGGLFLHSATAGKWR
jgi:hypothetical protein